MTDNRAFLYPFVAFLFVLAGCQSSGTVVDDLGTTATKDPSVLSLASFFDTSEVFNNNFTGFALYDTEVDSMLFELNADKYYTPASNTKLYTFFASLKHLPDSLLALEYTMSGDSLIFWGTGDPTFLHPDFEESPVFEFLKEAPLNLYYSDNHYDDKLLGPGWAWGDYQYYYSTEKSPFPIYGNVVEITIEEIEQVQISLKDDKYDMSPKFFRSMVDTASSRPGKDTPFLFRDFNDNKFAYSPKSDTVKYTTSRPFHYTPELITELLSDTLGKKVEYIDRIKPDETHRIYSTKLDTVLTRMLQPSDNFIAEQLLLNIASELGRPLNTRNVINYIREEHFQEFDDEPVWRDGSGLSRYNLFTPQNMIDLLKLIDAEFENDADLYRHLPAGGKSGTIRNWYAHREGGEPYVFAKTGTLSNNHCLSGYIVTEKGNKMMFSFMNNHYVTSSGVVKEEMEKVLWHIYKNF